MKPEETNKMTKQETGRMGAIVLNSDKEKKLEAARKAARTNLAKDPDYYRKMAIRKNEKAREKRLEK